MRSRTVSRPWSRCRLTFSTPPISRAKASRRASSSSSGFQFILVLPDDLVVMSRYRQRLILGPAAEDVAIGALEQMADSSTQLDQPRRDLLVQSRFVIHRRQ